jgi:hypothetical protein
VEDLRPPPSRHLLVWVCRCEGIGLERQPLTRAYCRGNLLAARTPLVHAVPKVGDAPSRQSIGRRYPRRGGTEIFLATGRLSLTMSSSSTSASLAKGIHLELLRNCGWVPACARRLEQRWLHSVDTVKHETIVPLNAAAIWLEPAPSHASGDGTKRSYGRLVMFWLFQRGRQEHSNP